MEAAWIGFAGGVLATLVSLVVAWRQRRMDRQLVVLKDELERAARAEEVLDRYRQPLAAAAFDLQARFYNILCLGFVAKFGGGTLSDEARRTTIFRIAQYLGWSEMLRRDVQFLRYPRAEETRRIAKLQQSIAELFLNSDLGPAMMIWRDEQRAIGERMIVEEHGKVICMGYASFSDCCEKQFGPWLDRLWADISAPAAPGASEPSAHQRMRKLQHALRSLVILLDHGQVLPVDKLERA